MIGLRIIAIAALGASLATPVAAQTTSPISLRIGVQSENTKQNSSLDDVVTGRVSAALQAIEGVISPAEGGAGIGGRVIQGTLEGGRDFFLREGRLFIGPQWFHAEAAYGERTLSGTDSMVTFSRAGVRSIVQIGGSGVAVIFSGSKYFGPKFVKAKVASGSIADPVPDGWEAETSIYYTAPRVPVFLRVGYKTEYFSYANRDDNTHSVIFGTGLWLGAR